MKLLTAVLLVLTAQLAAGDAWDQLAEISRKPAAEARVALEQMLVRDPNFAAARFNLGTLLLESDSAKAAEQLELAANASSGALEANAVYNLALARFQQGRLDDAMRIAERAVKLDPQATALRDEIRRVALARMDEARRKAEEEARKLHLAPLPLPEGRVGEAYQAKVPMAGGSETRRAVLAGTSQMPAGLTLASDGTISGTPHEAGTTRLDLALSDQAGGTATGTVELRILPRPAITTEQLPEAILGEPYEARLASVGFPASLRWEVAGVPAGLTAGADGVLRGTPTAIGTSTLHVHAAAGTLTANRLIDLVVSDSFAPAEDPLPPATATAAYEHRVTVRGPAQAYRWSAAAGAALTISPDGTIRGVPEQAGDLQIPVTISAADRRSRQVTLKVPVNPMPLIQPEPITLQAGSPVQQALKVEGGTPPYAWSVVRGMLPAGLRLDPDGQLRGVVKHPGTTTVTVGVADRWKATTQAEVSITVEPAKDPPPDQQDQAKQDQQDQQGQDKQDKQDQQGQDQQGKQGEDSQDKQQLGKQDKQDKQTQNKQDQGQQQEAGEAGSESKEQQAAAAQAAAMQQTAADHWLDQLPEERRDSLRYQLLDGGDKKPKQQGKAW